MRKLQTSRIVPRGILLLLVLWGCASFFLFKSPLPAEILVVTFALIATYLILAPEGGPSPKGSLRLGAGLGELFVLYFLSFINFYAFYGLLFTYNLPLYVIMLGIALVFGVSFLFLGQKFVNRNFFYLYLLFFVIIILELFLTLSFWLVNPLTRSLVMVVFVYLLFGFWISISDQQFDKISFRNYLIISIIVLVMIMLTVGWGH